MRVTPFFSYCRRQFFKTGEKVVYQEIGREISALPERSERCRSEGGMELRRHVGHLKVHASQKRLAWSKVRGVLARGYFYSAGACHLAPLFRRAAPEMRVLATVVPMTAAWGTEAVWNFSRVLNGKILHTMAYLHSPLTLPVCLYSRRSAGRSAGRSAELWYLFWARGQARERSQKVR
jgi:hypothetical protein